MCNSWLWPSSMLVPSVGWVPHPRTTTLAYRRINLPDTDTFDLFTPCRLAEAEGRKVLPEHVRVPGAPCSPKIIRPTPPVNSCCLGSAVKTPSQQRDWNQRFSLRVWACLSTKSAAKPLSHRLLIFEDRLQATYQIADFHTKKMTVLNS